MPGSILGTRVTRVEDPALLRGRTSFVDNLDIVDQAGRAALRLAFVRSPLAHARITGIDTAAAASAPGVVAVYTATDLAIPRYHPFIPMDERCARPPLADDRVRFVGDAVAVVVAETAAAAVDAAELVDVDYEPLDAVVNPEAAVTPGAPLQFPELGSNVASGVRDPATPDPLAGADVVVRARMENQRVAVVPMEGNGVAVVPGDGQADLTVWMSTQMPHLARSVAARVFGLPEERVRVVAGHVGGAFGSKAGLAPEHAVAIAVARTLGRAVKWVETRSENLVAMPHGRAQIQYVQLGVRRDGTITGLRCQVIGDCGAYAGFGGMLALSTTYAMATGAYRIPALSYDAMAVLTNTSPVGAFRGAGRPEAAAYLERIVDMAAAELGMDPVTFRRRNFLAPQEFPLTTHTGSEYDSGDYDRPLTVALRLAGYDELRAEQARRREAGDNRLLGIGISSYVEITGGGAGEYSSVRLHEDGTVTLKVGTSAHGQGHATAFAMVVADRLGLPIDAVRFVQSDTAAVPTGGGTGGSRSLQVGGSAVHRATGVVLQRARDFAGWLFEAAPEDIVVSDDGRIGVAGVPSHSMSWAELAQAAGREGVELAAALNFDQGGATFPFGAHVSVVEVDAETGKVTPLDHVAVDDCGRVLNPLLVAGQQHGGTVQGIAQALWEHYVYDADGNPMSATLADYLLPTAADVPDLRVASTETPTPRNPLGAKGIGESPTVGATPAVQNAVVDAVSHLGVRHIDLPCTPQRVWRAISDARRGAPANPWREPPAAFNELPLRPSGEASGSAGPDI